MPYYSQPLTLHGVIWVTSSSLTPHQEGHVEFTMHFPDREHCTLCCSREDTPEVMVSLLSGQVALTRQVVAMLLGGCPRQE